MQRRIHRARLSAYCLLTLWMFGSKSLAWGSNRRRLRNWLSRRWIWAYSNFLMSLLPFSGARILRTIWTQERMDMKFDIRLTGNVVVIENSWIKHIGNLRDLSWWVHNRYLVDNSQRLLYNSSRIFSLLVWIFRTWGTYDIGKRLCNGL